MENKNWTIPDEDGRIKIPPHLVPLFSKISKLVREHTEEKIDEAIITMKILKEAEDFFETK